MSTKAAIVLAGGLGTRLRSVVPDLPKPMAPVAGRPLLEWLLDHWIAQGVERFTLATAYRAEVIRSHFGDHYRDATIDYAVEETPLGTGGGLLRAALVLGSKEPFLVLNGDTYFAVELWALDAFADTVDADWCFSLFRSGQAGRYMGMDVAEDGRVTSLRSGSASPGRLANGGVYRVHPRALEPLASLRDQVVSLEDRIFPTVVALGQRLYGCASDGAFLDIGTPEDYARTESLLRERTAS